MRHGLCLKPRVILVAFPLSEYVWRAMSAQCGGTACLVEQSRSWLSSLGTNRGDTAVVVVVVLEPASLEGYRGASRGDVRRLPPHTSASYSRC